MIAVRGRGRTVLGDQAQDMQSLDTVYIAPWTKNRSVSSVVLTRTETARCQARQMNMIRRSVRGRLPENKLLLAASAIPE